MCPLPDRLRMFRLATLVTAFAEVSSVLPEPLPKIQNSAVCFGHV